MILVWNAHMGSSIKNEKKSTLSHETVCPHSPVDMGVLKSGRGFQSVTKLLIRYLSMLKLKKQSRECYEALLPFH